MTNRWKLSGMTVFFAMLLGVAVMFIGTEQACAMEGDGTEDDPYRISDYAELKEFAAIVNGTHSTTEQNTEACAILTEDIECTDRKWTPIGGRIGGSNVHYYGTFDGKGNTIRGLSNIECEKSSRQGLFGSVGVLEVEEVIVSVGTVQNVGLENVNFHGESHVGGVAGINTGKISGCHVAGTIGKTLEGTPESNGSIGGVAGRNLNGGTIEDCYNIADVSGSGQFVGGVTGSNDNRATMSNCHNSGDVSGSEFVGGVTGCNNIGSIEGCYNTGNVSGTEREIGGVAGINYTAARINNCYNTGNVSGIKDQVGGVVGNNDEGTIENCYNVGDVSGSAFRAGGVVGTTMHGGIYNCYNIGNVVGGDLDGYSPRVGGVVGEILKDKEITIDYCYYDKTRCGCNYAIGFTIYEGAVNRENVKGLTTEDMTGKGALENMVFTYDSDEIKPWIEKVNDSCNMYYPHLKGFNFNDNGEQMDAEDIPPSEWPPVIQTHTWDLGKVTKKPTAKATGTMVYTCTVCKATKTETIAKLEAGTPLVKMKAGKKSLTIAWNKTPGAEGYDIFFAKCNHGKKEKKCRKIKTIKGNQTFKWTKTGLKKGIAYKAYVKAFIYDNGKKTYISKSPMYHAFTGNGSKNYTNAKSVTIKNVKKGKLTLTKGKTFKIKAKVNKISRKKKLVSKKHAPTLRYLTTDKKVATVSKSGKITAKGSGTCTIVAFAHNGVSKTIKVVVK